MNKYLFIEAIGHLELDLIDEHIRMKKELLAQRKLNIKRYVIAACIALILCVPFIINCITVDNAGRIEISAIDSIDVFAILAFVGFLLALFIVVIFIYKLIKNHKRHNSK